MSVRSISNLSREMHGTPQIQIQKYFIASYLHQQLTVTSHILYHKVHKSTQNQIVNIIQI